MKIEFFENKFGASFDIIPETPAEVAMIARIANNASSEPPDVRFYFSGDVPTGVVWIKKIKESVQKNSIGRRR
mgnify:FL=1